MTHPALDSMSREELTALIEQATKLLATKFETDVVSEKPYMMETEQALEQKLDSEMGIDPVEVSPTALRR